MTDYRLRDPERAIEEMATVFATGAGESPLFLALEVLEDECFRGTWVPVGTVAVQSRETSVLTAPDEDGENPLRQALRYGFFEWRVPERTAVADSVRSALLRKDDSRKASDSNERFLRNAVNAIVRIAVRCGLTSPIMDPMMVSRLSDKDSFMVMMDTSAILQGGLDFVRLHLTPRAKIGVPSIAHMEIITISDNFLKQRRSPEKQARSPRRAARMLADHTLSQSGQRALLRIGMEHEVERPRLGADPLRGIVQPDSDAEDRRLGLDAVQRSFADRLILETAIQRRREALPGVPVLLMTADQGLARMALAEGIEPMWFRVDSLDSVFGSTLTGVPFRPWRTDGPRTYPVALTSLVWECAVTFGAARLRSGDSGAVFEAMAMSGEYSWQPYHARRDLLWTRSDKGAPRDDSVHGSRGNSRSAAPEPKISEEDSRRPRPRGGSYKISARTALRLISALEEEPLSDEAGMRIAGSTADRGYAEYHRFLVAGGLAVRARRTTRGTESLRALLAAFRQLDFERIRGFLAQVPSLGDFLESLANEGRVERTGSRALTRVFPGYSSLAEMCCAGIRLDRDAIHATKENPVPERFVASAMTAYDSVRGGEAFAVTGRWLECLARDHHIHPVRARQRLAEARQAGLLDRYFEGSTPETRFPDRKFQALVVESGEPGLREVNLYHGDFLQPGQAAASLRLVRANR